MADVGTSGDGLVGAGARLAQPQGAQAGHDDMISAFDKGWTDSATARIEIGIRARRVTQLDAMVLHDEMVELLSSSLASVAGAIKPGAAEKYEPELRAVVSAALLPKGPLSVPPSLAIQDLGIRHIAMGQDTPHTPSRLVVLFYTFLKVATEWAKQRWSFLSSLDRLQPMIQGAWWWWVIGAWRLAQLVNTAVFLRHGAYVGLVERLCGIVLVHDCVATTAARTPPFDFVYRDLLLKTVTGLCATVASVADWQRLMRRGTTLARQAYLKSTRFVAAHTPTLPRWLSVSRRDVEAALDPTLARMVGEESKGDDGASAHQAAAVDSGAAAGAGGAGAGATTGHGAVDGAWPVEAECGICGAASPMMPYRAQCRHIFCYYCLYEAAQVDPTFSCPKCGDTLHSSARL